MSQRIHLDNEVYLIHNDNLETDKISTFFVIAHGEQAKDTFLSDFQLYFPWGINEFGWYNRTEGFDIYNIYRNYRTGTVEGLTTPSQFSVTTTSNPGALSDTLSSPFQSRSQSTIPNIDLTANDLNVDFCEKMLTKYNTNTASDMYPNDIGILCVKKTSTLKKVLSALKIKLSGEKQDLLSKAKRFFSSSKSKNNSDVLVICLCCSVVAGGDGDAMNRAEGYKMMV